jgi:predicted RNA-binding protein YlxR (DUF448 family)
VTLALVAPHGPKRACVACRTKRPQSELVRIVRGPDGEPVVDLVGGSPGRGAYLCDADACRELAERRRIIRRALRLTDTASLVEVAHGA